MESAKRYVVIELDVQVDEDGELTRDCNEAILDIEHAVDAIQSQIVWGGPAYMKSVNMRWSRKNTLVRRR